MDEFLRQNYYLLTYSVEALAAVAGIFCYKKYKDTAAKYFICFLIYTFFVDFFGWYPDYFKIFGLEHLIEGTVFQRNHLWYTVFWVTGSAFFYSFFFIRILKTKLFKRILTYCTLAAVVIVLFQFIFNFDKFYTGNITTLSVVSPLVIFVAVILYFIETLLTDKILDFYKSLYFYISSVLLIWWLIITPVSFFEIYFSSADWNFVFLKWQIYLFANMFMYLTFTFALIFCKPEND